MKKQLMILISLFFILTSSTFAINEDGKVNIQRAGAKIFLYRHSLQLELKIALDKLRQSNFLTADHNLNDDLTQKMLTEVVIITDRASTSIDNELEKSKLTPTEKSEIKSKWSNPEEVLKGSEMNEILSNLNNWPRSKQAIEKSIIKAQKIIERELEKAS